MNNHTTDRKPYERELIIAIGDLPLSQVVQRLSEKVSTDRIRCYPHREYPGFVDQLVIQYDACEEATIQSALLHLTMYSNYKCRLRTHFEVMPSYDKQTVK